jgi:hypothetical protein
MAPQRHPAAVRTAAQQEAWLVWILIVMDNLFLQYKNYKIQKHGSCPEGVG